MHLYISVIIHVAGKLDLLFTRKSVYSGNKARIKTYVFASLGWCSKVPRSPKSLCFFSHLRGIFLARRVSNGWAGWDLLVTAPVVTVEA